MFSEKLFFQLLNVWLWERAFNYMGEIKETKNQGGKTEIFTKEYFYLKYILCCRVVFGTGSEIFMCTLSSMLDQDHET